MPNFAVIKDNKVVNVIVAEDAEIARIVTGAEVIETNGEIWLDWTRVDNVWQAPVVVEEPVVEEPTA